VAGKGRCLWIDASAGAAGDMLLGALLDSGASVESVNERLASLGVGPLRISLSEVRRHGFRATKADVVAGEGGADETGAAPRPLREILKQLRAAALPEPVRVLSEQVFSLLGEAESRVHGTSPQEAHLHEAGALDALADVVGTAAALDSLGLLEPRCRIVVSRVALGSGTAKADHGTLPVPVPAVLEIFGRVGAPVSGGIDRGAGRGANRGANGGANRAADGVGELCTPTGAALLATLADEWGDLPALQVEAVGIGAGTADPPGRPNVLRVVLGRDVSGRGTTGPEAAGWRDEEMLAVETTVDDLDPRLWPDVLDALVRAGSVDAWLTPTVMRKGRPGHVVTALVGPAVLDAVTRAFFDHTTTLGVRVHSVERRALARDDVVVEVDGCEVHVKRGLLDGVAVTMQPEYSDAAAAAARLGLPVRAVLERAAAIARIGVESDGGGR
jgi:uncharacterized protein (DUF111 family)